MAKNPPPPPPQPDPNRPTENVWSIRVREGDHPVEAGLGPERTVKLFKEAIDRRYVHIKFADLRSGTELGGSKRMLANFGGADFDAGNGTVHVVGGLTVGYVKARCIGDIDLRVLEKRGCLVKAELMERLTFEAQVWPRGLEAHRRRR